VTKLVIDLPDDLVRRAKQAGLLSNSAIQGLLEVAHGSHSILT
jgi:hypothetical protein